MANPNPSPLEAAIRNLLQPVELAALDAVLGCSKYRDGMIAHLVAQRLYQLANERQSWQQTEA